LKLTASSSSDVNYKLFYSATAAPERPFLNLLLPVGGEVYIGGSTISIFWNRGGSPWIDYVKLEYSTNGRSGPWHLIADSLTSNMYRWTTPVPESDLWSCYIRVSDTEGTIATARNNTQFRIRDPLGVSESNLPLTIDLLSASPNPFNSCVLISGSHGVSDIFDLNGKHIHTFEGSDYLWIPEASVSGGIYLVKNRASSNTLRMLYIP
jgi:hypothetical protein